MRFIPTRVHGIWDYLLAGLLFIHSWTRNPSLIGTQTIIPIIIGAALILYSLFTDYELGLIRNIPMNAHLSLDVLTGIVLALSPSIFDFNVINTPYLVLGIIHIGLGLITNPVPADCRTC